jgi:ferredoxin-NADP reductase
MTRVVRVLECAGSRLPDATVFDDTALSATLTALHLAVAVLRRHRAGVTLSVFVLPSFLFPALPWIWTSPFALAAGVAAHLGWLASCELLAPAARCQPRTASDAKTAGGSLHAPPGAAPRAAQEPAARGVATPVLARIDETADISTFRLARPEGFDFTAGQFVTVRVSINGKPHVRCYSISSPPSTSGYLEISVRRQGVVSNTLHALLRPGAQMTLGRPAGTFVYPNADDRPIALIAGGVGITPLMAMLRHAVAADPTRPIALLYSVRRTEDVVFLSELKTIAERHPQVRVAITVTQSRAVGPWRSGRIDAAMVQQYVAHPSHTIFLMCGPAPMIDEVGVMLATLGVPAEQIRSERFETAVAASVLNPAAPPNVTASAGGTYRINFTVSGKATVNTPTRTILEAAEAEGIAIPSSCRAGVCQACRTRVTSGEADCRSDMLADDDRRAGFILPCVSWAASDCAVEA